MRIVTKVNLALAAVVGISALLNFAALQLTVMPSFKNLEIEMAERNQSRVIEAIKVQMEVLANSAKDWAFWDDTYGFVNGEQPDYVEKNVDPDSMKSLGVNYLMIVDNSGKVILNQGYLFSDGDPAPIRIIDSESIAEDHAFRKKFDEPESRSGLLRTNQGILAAGYAPILTSDKSGEPRGTLIFGKLLDVDALRSATKVDFTLESVPPGSPAVEVIRGANDIDVRNVLNDINGATLAVLASKTSRSVSAAGEKAVWAALGLLLIAGMLLIVSLAFVLRRVALRRIEGIRSHLVQVGTTGNMEPIPADDKGDELSETIASFNHMAGQLRDLREKLRRQDYDQGAADHAAGILHNVRNAVGPVATIAWGLARSEEAPWKRNLASAISQLNDAAIDPERTIKLQQFVTLSAAKLLEEGEKRLTELEKVGAMMRHVDEILKDEDALSQSERPVEEIDPRAAAAAASQLIGNRPTVKVLNNLPAGALVRGHRLVLEQVLGNLLVNAAEAVEATGKSSGTVELFAVDTVHKGVAALDINIADDGDGILPDRLEAIFEKGFSTRRERSSGLGLHWCANAISAMGGRLHATSEGSGCGATLHVILPRVLAKLDHAA